MITLAIITIICLVGMVWLLPKYDDAMDELKHWGEDE